MIWKFIVSAITLTLALTLGANAQTPWVKSKYESPGGNPFAFNYYDDHIIVRNYDLYGSKSYIRLYRLRDWHQTSSKFSIIVTWDLCANFDVDDSMGVRLSFGGGLSGSMSKKFVVQSTGINWCQLQPAPFTGFPAERDTTDYNDYLADFDELWIELSLDLHVLDSTRELGSLFDRLQESWGRPSSYYLHFNISGQPDLSW